MTMVLLLSGCVSAPEQKNYTTPTRTNYDLYTPGDTTSIYSDNFSKNEGRWWIANNSEGKSYFGDGQYRILVYKNDRGGNCSSAGLSLKDAVVKVEITQISGNPENSYSGLSFRNDENQNYDLVISTSGYFAVSKTLDGDQTPIIDWMYSPYLKWGNETNTITVTQNGSLFEIYFNGQYITRFFDNDLTSGDIAFCVFPGPDSDSEYAFDNLYVYKYDPNSPFTPKKPDDTPTPTYQSITWLELADFLSRDHTNWNEYVLDEYVCTDFAIDLVENALKENIKAWIVAVDFTSGDMGHAFVAFETSDKGIVYVEPQGDNPYVDVGVGKNLCDYWGKAECMGVISDIKYVQCEHEIGCWNNQTISPPVGTPKVVATSTLRTTQAPTVVVQRTPVPTQIPIQPTVSHPELDITIKVTNQCSEKSTVLFYGPVNLKYVVGPGETQEWQAAHGTYTWTVNGFPGQQSPMDLFETVWTLTLCP